MTAGSVNALVTDLNERGIEVETDDDPYEMTEGESITYRVRLDTQPSGTVTVTPSSDNSDVTLSPTTVEFSTTDWATFKTITATAGQDEDAAPEDLTTITHTASGADYQGATININKSVTLEIFDDDQAEVTVSATELTITEGAGGAYTVSLGSRPVGGNVTIEFTVIGSPDITVDTDGVTEGNQNSVEISPADWRNAQTVTVTAADDDDTRPDSGLIRHTVSGANFNEATIPDIPVTITEDDMAGIFVDTTSVTAGEGQTATYTVSLLTEPSGTVTVAISSDNADVTTNPARLTFTTTDWSTAQTVTITAAEDNDTENDTAMLSHTGSGQEYNELAGPVVTVMVVENGNSVRDTSSFLQNSSCDGRLLLTWNAPTGADAAAIMAFRIQWKTGEEAYDTSRLANAPADATSHTLENLQNGVKYDIRITAVDQLGNPLWLRETTGVPSESSCITEISFGNILADSTPVTVVVEAQESATQVNVRHRSLNPGVWSEVMSQTLPAGNTKATFDIRGLNPSSAYEVQAWLGTATPPRDDQPTDPVSASPTPVAQAVFTSGHAPEGTVFSGGSRGGKILRIEPSIRSVTVGAGDELLLSVEVYGRQNIHDNGLADRDPEDDRPVFTWTTDGGVLSESSSIRAEWQNSFADDRTVRFTAPSGAGTYKVSASLDGSFACLAAQEGETSADQAARCGAEIEVVVRRRNTSTTQSIATTPVNPPGTIPETLTDSEGVAYAVFTPVVGGIFAGDGYSLTAGPGAVANSEIIGLAMAPTGDASNEGMTWHRYTLAGQGYAVAAVDAAGEPISEYALNAPATACVPLPAELRGNIADLVLVRTDSEGGLSVQSSRVRLTPDGAMVCGALSAVPATLAVGRAGAPAPLPEEESVAGEELPDTGGYGPASSVPMAVLLLSVLVGFAGVLMLLPHIRRIRYARLLRVRTTPNRQ